MGPNISNMAEYHETTEEVVSQNLQEVLAIGCSAVVVISFALSQMLVGAAPELDFSGLE